ncbi:hypothetical protein DNY73_25625 [Salmonella enterica subsp. diarizonae]|uniref:hypothetical protein n=1 Tax=Salmonella enterica TaxID=28901 RepID=UPI0010BCA61D|nr:hypothetical protein [Salmonella enterica subsp. diarizonae]EAS0616027.1 hypothetical protein [Salmonella enterica subsp. enterica serovar Dahomey]EAW3064177.1 hypothetical protein [Salmonella enterica]EBQ9004993.1 hypothetical protein [Salmonella enterica subsp. enterica serovar Blockley]EBQ9480351.1 hypothetical protein [Salmonella enterica subsp. enterica serovar Kokomlemle]EDX5413583.1 hypothetical protein [Salmonella enterica subsp. enterica serovar Ealing]
MNNKITLDFKGIQALEQKWKDHKNFEHKQFSKLLSNSIAEKQNNNSDVKSLKPDSLDEILKNFTSNINSIKKHSNANPVLSRDQHYILENKFLRNRVLYAIGINKLINNIDFKKSHFIKI